MFEQLQEWDRKLFISINSLGVEEYDHFWIFITKIEHWVPLYLLFFFLFYRAYVVRKSWIGVTLTFLTFILTLGLTNLTKIMVKRIRPNNDPELSDVIRILQTPVNFSFFSGHAAVSFAVTTFVVLALKHRFGWVYLFYVWPFLFLISRVFVGVHYPSDLLAGSFVGTLIAVIIWNFLGKRWLR